MKRTIAALVVLSMAGCGARTSLDVGADGDGPSLRDAGRRDAGSTDAGVPPVRRDAGPVDAEVPTQVCLLEVRVPPTTIFTERSGTFNAPQVEIRGGLVDLFATFLPFTDDRIPQPYGSRFDLALAPAGGLSGYTATANAMFTATIGDTLGVCFQDLGTRFPALTTFEASGSFRSEPLDILEGACLGLAGNAGRWMVAQAFGEGFDAEPYWFLLEREGGFVTMPTPLATRLPGARMAVTPFREGFAWVVTSPTGEAFIGTVTDGFDALEHRLLGVPGSAGGAAIAPWAYDPSRLAIAAWSGSLVVIVVDPISGAEVQRSEPLAFGMFADERPAIIAHPRGVVVASKDYGDIDPSSGLLEVSSVDARGRPTSTLTFPVRRQGELPDGLDMATDGRSVVLHWSDTETDASGADLPVTRAMVLDCALP